MCDLYTDPTNICGILASGQLSGQVLGQGREDVNATPALMKPREEGLGKAFGEGELTGALLEEGEFSQMGKLCIPGREDRMGKEGERRRGVRAAGGGGQGPLIP